MSRMIPHLCLCSLCFLQSCNISLINQACSGPYWENIRLWSFLYGPRCARSVLSRPRADILPVRPSRLVNKIYIVPLIELGAKLNYYSASLTCKTNWYLPRLDRLLQQYLLVTFLRFIEIIYIYK